MSKFINLLFQSSLSKTFRQSLYEHFPSIVIEEAADGALHTTYLEFTYNS
jgi:hypothetical protein